MFFAESGGHTLVRPSTPHKPQLRDLRATGFQLLASVPEAIGLSRHLHGHRGDLVPICSIRDGRVSARQVVVDAWYTGLSDLGFPIAMLKSTDVSNKSLL